MRWVAVRVFKIGGSVLARELDKTVNALSPILKKDLVVHGGGALVDELTKRLGIEPKVVTSPQGVVSRYTDEQTMNAVTMAIAGLANKALVTALLVKGVRAVGLSGADGLQVRAERKERIVIINERGRQQAVDGGYSGRIVDFDPTLATLLLGGGYVPVIAPVCATPSGRLLNTNSDVLAQKVACSLVADELIFLTNVPGVMVSGSVVHFLSLKQAQQILPAVGQGMQRKVMAAVDAVKAGVKLVKIVPVSEELASLLYQEDFGTTVGEGNAREP